MTKDFFQSSPENTMRKQGEVTEPKPDKEKIVDAQIERLLIQYGEKINEGNNGVIYLIEIPKEEEEREEFSAVLDGLEVEDTNEKVFKLLKFYRPGTAEKEYKMQKMAYETLQAANFDGEIAQTPKVSMFRDLDLSQEAVDKLTSRGMAGLTEKVEMIVMDFVPGEDLATLLYKEVVRTHPKLVHLASKVDELSFDDLQEEVSLALNFKAPGGKARDEGERNFEAEKVANDNAKELMRYLKRNKFNLDPTVGKQIKNVLKVLHDNGIAHRDCHSRNFMLSTQEINKEQVITVHLIDFGAATTFQGQLTDDVYKHEDGMGRYVQDEQTLKLLEPLMEDASETEKNWREQYQLKLERLEEYLEPRKEWENLFDMIPEKGSVDYQKIFNYIMPTFPGSEEQRVMVMAVLMKQLIEDEEAALEEKGKDVEGGMKEFKDEIIQFLNKQIVDTKKYSMFVVNKLKDLLKYFS